MSVYIFLLAILVLATTNTNTTNKIWPKPATFSSNPHGEKVKISPCEVEYVFSSQLTA